MTLAVVPVGACQAECSTSVQDDSAEPDPGCRLCLQRMPGGDFCRSGFLTEQSRYAQLYMYISRLSVLGNPKNTAAMTVFTKGSGS